jgi:phenylacetate-CoA ligase
VKVERRPDADPDVARRAGEELRHHVKSRIGVTVAVDVVEPDTVERSVGKMKRIVDLRKKG